MRIKTAWLVCLLLLCGMCGCENEPNAAPETFSLIADNARAVPLETPFEIRVQAMAAPRRTALGGVINTPAAGARAAVKVVSSPDKDLPPPPEAVTGSDGIAVFSLKKLHLPGIYHYSVSLPDFPEITPLEVFVYGGIGIVGDGQDGWVGRQLHEPVRISAQKAVGVPAEGVEFAFDVRTAPVKTELLASRAATEKNGKAYLSLKMGGEQGRGVVGMRVLSAPWNTDPDVPDLKISFFTLDPWNLLLGVAGGLAIFIFGMGLMSEGLTLIAGEKLRAVLHSLTRNRFAAAGMGLAITAFIQSSSATSVMVIGFVNAALMNLEQAVGVIIGANIGSTVTAQILSFKLDVLAYPAIAIGVVYSLIAKKSKGRFVAQILIGFGLLFLGMQLMSGPLGELRYSQFIRNVVSYLDCTPVDGFMPLWAVGKAICVGMLMTMLMQSSAAFIGVMLALSAAGLLDPYTALAVLFGSNIGTTITAVLATIGTSVAAKRVACAHVVFNLLGTALITATLYIPWHGQPAFMVLVNQFTPGNIFNNENIVRFLANAHTAFNVVCAAVFICFVGALARLTTVIFPDAPKSDKESAAKEPPQRILDSHLLNVPALAISLAWMEISVMLKKGGDAFFPSLRAIFDCDGKNDHNFEKLTEDVKQLEADVDSLQSSITGYISNVTVKTLMTESEGAAIAHILHSVNDAERVSDHAMHLIRLAKRSHKHSLHITPEAVKELAEIEGALSVLFHNSTRIIEEKPAPGYLVEESHNLVKHMHKLINDAGKAHLVRQENGQCDVRSGAIYQELLYNLHRVGSHLNNVIKAVGGEVENNSGMPLANKPS